MTLLNTAIVLACVAAIGGATIWLTGRSGRKLPLFVPIGHGLLALSAIILAVIVAIERDASSTSVWAAISFLVVAAGCGAWMLTRWAKHSRVSPFVRAAHFGAAAVGLLLLILSAFV